MARLQRAVRVTASNDPKIDVNIQLHIIYICKDTNEGTFCMVPDS